MLGVVCREFRARSLSGLKTLSSLTPGPLDVGKIVEGMSSWMPIGTIDFLLFIVLLILFSVWAYWVNSNARAIGAEGMRFSPAWAVGWFFVPIMSFFKPYQVVREVWKASDPEVLTGWDQIQTPALLKAWWAVWLLSIVGIQLRNLSFTAGLIKFLMVVGVIKILAHVGSCLLSFLLVRNVHQRQEARWARVQPTVSG